MQHVTFDVSMIDKDIFSEGTMFDGSSIAGWKAINESDMVMRPDPAGAHIDPFFQQTTLALFCDILEPGNAAAVQSLSARGREEGGSLCEVRRLRRHLLFGPEAEFFVFDDVRWNTDPNNTGYSFDSTELPYNTGRAYEGGNMGHRPGPKGGYFPVPPIDSLQDMRGEMLQIMGELGMRPEKHHHEVAPAQHELGLKFDTLTTMADRMNLYKYIIHQVAQSYGKSATFMPKPYYKDNGSGMHVHQSIWKGRQEHLRRRQVTPIFRIIASITSAASSSTRARSTRSRTRRRIRTSASCPVTKPRCCSRTRRATARLRAVFRTAPAPKQSALKFASPIRAATCTSRTRRF